MKKSFALVIAALPLAAIATSVQAQEAGSKIANSYICVFDKAAVGRGAAMSEANRAVQAQGG